jgi:TfoX/Sxy family transcriptional regulator of competence genes
MPYNQVLAERIQAKLANRPGIIGKKMFGGVGYMLKGNMVCGVIGEDLIVRVGIEQNEAVLSQPYTRPFLAPVGGKPMAGWILVSPEGWEDEQDLSRWVDQAYDFAQTLPEKK